MTGIERLRELARRRGTLVVPPVHGMYGAGYVAATEDMSERLSDIADQIEREQVEAAADHAIVASIASDMERHVLGHEGMEDSPVARWARELREALGCADEADEDREAVAWVRAHGGLDKIKRQRRESIPRDAYERKRDGWLDHIAECEAALRKRNERIAELEARLNDFQKTQKVGVSLTSHSDESPAPKALDADGAEIREGDTVWHVETGEQCKVVEVNSKSVSVDFHVGGDGTKHTGSILPVNLAHRAPVLAADGKPLRVGEHVYHVETGTELVVKRLPKPGEYQAVVVFALPASPASHLTSFDPDRLTHERPEIDSWERLEEEARSCTCVMEAIDLVRRAKALAERGE